VAPAAGGAVHSYGAKLIALVSIGCWISIILLGRWIAYTQ